MIKNYPVLTKVGIVFIDAFITIISYILAIYVRNYFGFSEIVDWHLYLNMLLIILVVWRGLTEYQEAYAGKAYAHSRYLEGFKSLREDVLIVFRTVFFGCPLVYLLSVSILYITRYYIQEGGVPKSLIFFFGLINLVLLSAEKIIVYKITDYFKKSVRNSRKVLILGTGDLAKHFIESIRKYSDRDIKVLGLISENENSNEKEKFGLRVLDNLRHFKEVLHSVYIDELIIALPAKHMGNIEEVIDICDKEGVPVRIISPFFKNLISKSKTETVNGYPTLTLLPVEQNDLEVLIKRMIDIVFSFILMVLLLPLLLVIAVMIEIDSTGPVFYRWKILGLHKRPLTSYKFRTMVVNADSIKKQLMSENKMTGAAFKMENDPRITRLGKWLRKYSIDELPQLWSVFKGDISLVGPRPPLQSEVEQYKGWHRRKLSVKPGITCLWQVSGRNVITDFDEWIKLDLKYIDEWSLWLDFKIFIRTIIVIIKGTGM
jgi:exopolysaccharide biosynthesis polyprenyl glycosylphosphotransferase